MELQSQQTTTTQQQPDAQATPNRQYKDTLFKFIFGREENKKWLLSLYNALAGTNCTDENEIELNTIEGIVYITRKNDVSFLIGTELYLIEHQSTFNPNLPLRGLLYFSQLYSKYIETHKETVNPITGEKITQDLYGTAIFKIPAPKFYVLYNGDVDKPDRMFLRLSDAFETPSEGFEWTTTMLNVNYGHNKDLLDACKSLHDFSKYVNMISINKKKKKMSESDAVDAATDEAIRLGLLEGFFKIHKAEVKAMCLTEFNQEEYDASRRCEGAHDKAIEIAQKMLDTGLLPEQISQCTGLPIAEVTALQQTETPA